MVTAVRIALWVTFLTLAGGFCLRHLPTYLHEMSLRRRAALAVTRYTRVRASGRRDAVWCNNADRTLWLDTHGTPLGETAPARTTVRLAASLWGRIPDEDELSGATVTVATPVTPQPGDIARIDITWAGGHHHRVYTAAAQ